MTAEEIAHTVKMLDALPVTDPEWAHSMVDQILLMVAPKEIEEAVNRVIDRAPWWVTA